MSARTLLILATIAASIPQVLPAFGLPVATEHAILSIVSAIGAIITGIMRSPLETPAPLLDRPTGTGREVDIDLDDGQD